MPSNRFDELLPVPERGRVYAGSARPGLADCAPSGRVRLDALARWLQDVAYDDVQDAGVAGAAVWVVRRMRIKVDRFPQFGEHFTLRTFCSGFGRMWAERRTTIALDGAATVVDAVSLWVHLDPESWRPEPITPLELELYGEAAAGRRVTARLRHPAPGDAPVGRRWTFRATDCDLADHVNNAAYWEPIEEELLAGGSEPTEMDVEMEFRNPAQPGDKLVFAEGDRRWIVGDGGETHASVLLG